MSTTYTANAKLGTPAYNDPNWYLVLDANRARLDAVPAVGALAVTTFEVPSASLNVAVAAGQFRQASGAVVSYAGVSSQAVTTAATNYLYLTDAGALALNTTGFPSGVNVVPLAVVVAGATTITSVTDKRVAYESAGLAGMILPATAVTSGTATLSAANPLVQVNFGGAVALTLPAASAVPAGAVLRVMDVSGAASGNNITVTRAGSDTVNGGTSTVISTNYGGVRLWCDGASKWFLIP